MFGCSIKKYFLTKHFYLKCLVVVIKDDATLTWEACREEFYEQYFPRAFKERKKNKFEN